MWQEAKNKIFRYLTNYSGGVKLEYIYRELRLSDIEISYPSLKNLIVKMRRKGDLTRHSRGIYALSPWRKRKVELN